MKRLIALLLAFSLLACPVFADVEEEVCEHFRVWAEWNEELSTETLDGERHRITAVCPDCGETVYRDEDHAFSLSDAEPYDAEQHRRMKTCAECGYGVYVYADHDWQFGEWQSENEGLYYRIAVCAACGAENPTPEFFEVETAEDEESELPENTPEPDELQPETETPEETPAMPWSEPQSQEKEPDVFYPETVETVYPVAVMSVTVPDNLPLTATGDGFVYAIDNLSIVNYSDGAVKVGGIIVDAAGGWSLMPYTGSTATGGAGVKSIGIYVNGAVTTGYGMSESLYLPGNWTIDKGASLPLCYNATVSFADIPREGTQVLTLTFILEWA